MIELVFKLYLPPVVASFPWKSTVETGYHVEDSPCTDNTEICDTHEGNHDITHSDPLEQWGHLPHLHSSSLEILSNGDFHQENWDCSKTEEDGIYY